MHDAEHPVTGLAGALEALQHKVSHQGEEIKALRAQTEANRNGIQLAYIFQVAANLVILVAWLM